MYTVRSLFKVFRCQVLYSLLVTVSSLALLPGFRVFVPDPDSPYKGSSSFLKLSPVFKRSVTRSRLFIRPAGKPAGQTVCPSSAVWLPLSTHPTGLVTNICLVCLTRLRSTLQGSSLMRVYPRPALQPCSRLQHLWAFRLSELCRPGIGFPSLVPSSHAVHGNLRFPAVSEVYSS